MSRECFWEEFGRRLDFNYSLVNKAFWQSICRFREKSLITTISVKESTGNILRNEKKILSRGKEYFEDLLNPVKATPTDTRDTIYFLKDKVFTLIEAAAAIRGLKSGKAAGEDKIRLKMLKALNRD